MKYQWIVEKFSGSKHWSYLMSLFIFFMPLILSYALTYLVFFDELMRILIKRELID